LLLTRSIQKAMGSYLYFQRMKYLSGLLKEDLYHGGGGVDHDDDDQTPRRHHLNGYDEEECIDYSCDNSDNEPSTTGDDSSDCHSFDSSDSHSSITMSHDMTMEDNAEKFEDCRAYSTSNSSSCEHKPNRQGTDAPSANSVKELWTTTTSNSLSENSLSTMSVQLHPLNDVNKHATMTVPSTTATEVPSLTATSNKKRWLLSSRGYCPLVIFIVTMLLAVGGILAAILYNHHVLSKEPEQANSTTPIVVSEDEEEEPKLFKAQYIIKMEHFTSTTTTNNDIPDGSLTGGVPRVRYLCRGTFDYIYAHQDVRNNPRFTCEDIEEDEDGFSGLECFHVCGPQAEDCEYWWHHQHRMDEQADGNTNDNKDDMMATNWHHAGFWFQCSGSTLEDTQARYTWEPSTVSNAVILPSGATSVKLARMEVRTDFEERDVDLMNLGYFPVGDRSTSVVNTNPQHMEDDLELQMLNDNGAPDGGYYVWTGAPEPQGEDRIITFGRIVIDSDPTHFPQAYIKYE
jgi:hypothetical protein